MNTKVKICGVTTEEAVDAAISSGAEYIGFVFYSSSPRNVVPERAAEFAAPTPSAVKKVAVVVDPTDEDIANILAVFKPDFFQLQGKETVERVAEIKKISNTKIIKAISVRSADDIASSGIYKDVCDMFLFDARVSQSMPGMLPGGNGLKFDWNLLAERDFDKEWMLAGGLNASNVSEAISITGAKIVDASSSLEVSPGQKSPQLIEEFLGVVGG